MSAELLQEAGERPPPPQEERSPGLNPIAIMIFGTASVLLTGFVWIWPSETVLTPLSCLAIGILLFIIHLICCGRRLGAFDPGLWLPILMLLHYFGMVVTVDVFPNRLYTSYDVYGHGLPDIPRGFSLALVTMVLFLFGFHLLPTYNRNTTPDPSKPVEPKVLFSSMMLMLGGTAMMAVGVPIAGSEVLFGAYGEMKEAEKFGLSDFRLIGAGFLFAAGGAHGVLATLTSFHSLRFRLAVICCAFVLVFLLLTGDRSGMSLVIFAGGWALSQRFVRIPLWLTVMGFIFMFLLMPVIKEYREFRDVADSNKQSAFELAGATLYEMGSSVQVYCYTVNQMPSSRDYSYGKSIGVQLLVNVPNITGSVGAQYLSYEPLVYDPSKWVTWVASPNKYYNAGGGYGYAVGAEWYFNFGFPGVFFGMIWMGMVTAFFRNRSRKSAMWLINASLWYGFVLLAVRNDMGYPARTAMWPLAGYLVLNAIAGFTTRSKPQAYPYDSHSSGSLNDGSGYGGDPTTPFAPTSTNASGDLISPNSSTSPNLPSGL